MAKNVHMVQRYWCWCVLESHNTKREGLWDEARKSGIILHNIRTLSTIGSKLSWSQVRA